MNSSSNSYPISSKMSVVFCRGFILISVEHNGFAILTTHMLFILIICSQVDPAFYKIWDNEVPHSNTYQTALESRENAAISGDHFALPRENL